MAVVSTIAVVVGSVVAAKVVRSISLRSSLSLTLSKIMAVVSTIAVVVGSVVAAEVVRSISLGSSLSLALSKIMAVVSSIAVVVGSVVMAIMDKGSISLGSSFRLGKGQGQEGEQHQILHDWTLEEESPCTLR